MYKGKQLLTVKVKLESHLLTLKIQNSDHFALNEFSAHLIDFKVYYFLDQKWSVDKLKVIIT